MQSVIFDPVSNEILKKFGLAIKKLRNEAGLSQEKLAEATGFHRTYIGFVERGERNLSLKNIEIFAKTFHLSISELMIECENIKN
jgi:transcriptional regulator with XRE-family HTH domain